MKMIIEKRMKLTQHDCYISVTQRIQEKCFDLQVSFVKLRQLCTHFFKIQNEFVLNKLYIMANLCEIRLYDSIINQAVDQVCKQRIHFDY